MKRIGLIAGAGELPELVVREAKRRNEQVVVISLSGQDLSGIADKIYYYGVGQAEKVIKSLLTEGITEVVMVGKVDKTVLFTYKPLDETALSLLTKLKERDDQSIMSAVVEQLERVGINVLEQSSYLSELLATAGVLTDQGLTEGQRLDVEYGLKIARQIASLNIGQSVVVKDRMVLAVEAIEGTDEAILRGGRLGQSGAVVVKVAKPGHDMRFDIPTVGLKTINSLSEVKASVLAVEVNRVLLIDKTGMISQANNQGIVIVGV